MTPNIPMRMKPKSSHRKLALSAAILSCLGHASLSAATPITGDTIPGPIFSLGTNVGAPLGGVHFQYTELNNVPALSLLSNSITPALWEWGYGFQSQPNLVLQMSLNTGNVLTLYGSTPATNITLDPATAKILIGNQGVITQNQSTFSTAFGTCTATGHGSTAMGSYASASGDGSTAIGFYASASNIGSTAIGWEAFSSGESSIALGSSRAYASHSTAMGDSYAHGDYSTAMGYNAAARGYASTAMGSSYAYGMYSTATGESYTYGDYSTALGYSASGIGDGSLAVGSAFASGYLSTATGTGIASGGYAVAMGCNAVAYGNASTALGNASAHTEVSTAMGASTASGSHSTAMGASTASGGFSTAMGLSTASGSYSTAMAQSQATGSHTMASGFQARATSYSSTAFGRYNTSWVSGQGGSATTWVDTDPLFQVGNGTGSSAATASNALSIRKIGQTTLTNKAWKANNNVTPTTANADAEALVVEGHTRLLGNVTINVPQGDISMGIYGP